MRRIVHNALYWLLPSLICAWLHRDGLHSWFQADDFAFLGANTEYYNWPTFWRAVFHATPQGGFRPWSEHLFFFAFWHWFGWNALAYRIFTLIVQCGNLVLLSYLVRKLSGSKTAGFLAPILWIANSALATAMSWTCAIGEVLCGTFLLSALAILVHGQGSKRSYFLQLTIFVLGFGALELNIIYPALAAAYAFFHNRRLLPWTAPLFAISIAYYALHTAYIPVSTAGAYRPVYDVSMLSTFFKYWKLVFVPPFGDMDVHTVWTATLLASATLGIVLFLVSETRRRRYAAAFFACWFAISLAPLLPFRDHLTHYYLTIPLIGLACLGALAMARWKLLATPVVVLYLAIQLPTLAQGERWYLERSRAARALVLGVKQVHEWYPEKEILLTDVSSDLYGFTIPNVPFRLIPNARVYLAPEALQQISGLPPNIAPVSQFALPSGPTRHGLLTGSLVVFSAAGNRLKEVTHSYSAFALAAPDPELPRRVDPGLPAMSYLLGPEWYQLEGPFRWMAKSATLQMAGPRTAAERLYVSGLAVPESLLLQPLELSVAIDGTAIAPARIGPNDSSFTREFVLPANAVGKPSITVEVSVNHTLSAEAKRPRTRLGFRKFRDSLTVRNNPQLYRADKFVRGPVESGNFNRRPRPSPLLRRRAFQENHVRHLSILLPIELRQQKRRRRTA